MANEKELSKIKFNGTTYQIKDTVARSMATGSMHYIGITSTALTDGSKTGTLTPKAEGSLIKTTGFVNGDFVSYNQLEFVWVGDAWHELGSTGKLGSMAYADSASGKITPAGTISGAINISSSSSQVIGIDATFEVPAPTLTPVIGNDLVTKSTDATLTTTPQTIVTGGTIYEPIGVKNKTDKISNMVVMFEALVIEDQELLELTTGYVTNATVATGEFIDDDSRTVDKVVAKTRETHQIVSDVNTTTFDKVTGVKIPSLDVTNGVNKVKHITYNIGASDTQKIAGSWKNKDARSVINQSGFGATPNLTFNGTEATVTVTPNTK